MLSRSYNSVSIAMRCCMMQHVSRCEIWRPTVSRCQQSKMKGGSSDGLMREPATVRPGFPLASLPTRYQQQKHKYKCTHTHKHAKRQMSNGYMSEKGPVFLLASLSAKPKRVSSPLARALEPELRISSLPQRFGKCLKPDFPRPTPHPNRVQDALATCSKEFFRISSVILQNWYNLGSRGNCRCVELPKVMSMSSNSRKASGAPRTLLGILPEPRSKSSFRQL